MCVEFSYICYSPFKLLVQHRDLDFEYPANGAQGQGFADLFTELRTAFTQLQFNKGDTVPYQLTAAVSAGPANYQFLTIPQMNTALSYWNLMARCTFPASVPGTNVVDFSGV